jgi:hypothetical protein
VRNICTIWLQRADFTGRNFFIVLKKQPIISKDDMEFDATGGSGEAKFLCPKGEIFPFTKPVR